jgi:DNA polymerase
MIHLHLDFETKSIADLKRVGAHVYAQDPSTEILCAAYAFGDEPVQLWVPSREPLPTAIGDHVRAGGLFYAHNAAFELTVWNGLRHKYDLPSLRTQDMRCTMAMAYAMGLPGSLDEAAAAVGLDYRKDAKGSRVMLQLCKPRKIDGSVVTWWDDPAKYETLYAYCKQDVEVERALAKRLQPLSEAEQKLWVLDQEINARGVAVDTDAIEAGIALIEAEGKRLNEAMRAATGGAVATCTATGQLTDWLKWKGVVTAGVAKADVADLLSRDDLDADVRLALELRQEAAKSSTAKLKKMRDLAAVDGRMRGMFQYHGAATGRWAARGAQLQNLPRPTLVKKPVHVADAIKHFGQRDYVDMLYGPPLQVVSDCIRGLLVAAPGHELVVADYANIEGRVLAWLAGEEWKLDAFRAFDNGTGPDLYLLAASRIFRCTLDEAREHRQVGKVAELACGYQGGVGAFQTMAKNYGLEISDERAEQVKTAWRDAHVAIKDFWRHLESAALAAVRSGAVHRAGPIAFRKAGSFLWCQLPSKRVLCYPYPELKRKEMPWSTPEKPDFRDCLTYMAVNGVTRKWERCETYGGSLAENVTQAVARDLLADAIARLEAAGWKVTLHVHDEIAVEAPWRALPVDTLTTIMCDAPAWAAGLPVAAAGYSALRYRKD